ncbi:hypothetical protein LNP74_04710 [Klebsiella pneumoniae subsp. pneumoniae]|nr:hypothetical protein [Klebsiella pneumoniae subsp. pneumoniae]
MSAWAAAGRLIGYYEPHMNPWDALPGLVLMREAGGASNDFLAQGRDPARRIRCCWPAQRSTRS